MDVSENQNGSSEILHYGILGMKWGVRRTPEELGHRTKPSFSENRNVRKLKGEYKSALKNAKMRTQMADEDREKVAKADAYYEKLQKRGLGITKKTKEKRSIDIQNAETLLKKRLNAREIAEGNQERAMDILAERSRNLEKAVRELTEKYGKENVKQLQMRKRAVKAGEDFVIENVFKTGLRIQDVPIIGRNITGKQVAQWERETRNQVRDENIRKRAREGY